MISNSIVCAFYLLGEWGFVILCLYAIFFLKGSPNYLVYFVVGLVLNTILNMFLKSILRQPRPYTENQLKNILSKYGFPFCFQYKFTSDLFGMPSGHAQNTAFIVMFLYLVSKQNVHWIVLLFAALVLWNRIFFGYHSVSQVLVGVLIGSIVSIVFFNIAKRKIIGFLKEKKDDNFFGIS